MSEENDDGDSKEGFISRMSSVGGEYIDLLGELRGNDDELSLETEAELKFIVRPSSEEVAQAAYRELQEEVENESDIPFDDPRPVIREAERQIMIIRDDLIEKIEDIKKKEEESVSGAEIDTMLYIVDKKAGKTGKFTILGGAKSLIYNLAEEQDWHPYEREIVLKANEIAARENNLHRHLLLDSVVIIPNDEEIF
jgi:hypothetical protein